MRVKLGLIVLVFLQVVCLSQESEYEILNVSDGLPSNFVYRVYEDSKGYMWFATDKGAVRYDGHTMKVFDTSNGLPNDDVYRIFEDEIGRIWFSTMSHDLVFYKDDELTVIKNEFNRRPFPYYIDDEKIYFRQPGLFHFTINIDSTIDTLMNPDFSYVDHSFKETINRMAKTIGIDLVEKYEPTNLDWIALATNKSVFIDPLSKGEKVLEFGQNSFATHYFTQLKANSNDTFISSFSFRDSSFSFTCSSSIVKTNYNLEITNSQNVIDLDKNIIHVPFIDSNDNLWISTKKGVYIKKRKTDQLYLSKHNVAHLHEFHNILYAFDDLGSIYQILPNNVESIFTNTNFPVNHIYNVLSNKKYMYVTLENRNIKLIDKNNNLKSFKTDNLLGDSRSHISLKNSFLIDNEIYSVGNAITVWDTSCDSLEIILKEEFYCGSYSDKSDKLVVSDNKNIFIIDSLRTKNPIKSEKIELIGITYIKHIRESVILFSNKIDRSYLYINEKLNPISFPHNNESIIKVLSSKNETFMCTKFGIYKLDYLDSEISLNNIHTYNSNDISFEINDFILFQNDFYLATSLGVQKLDNSSSKNRGFDIPPTINNVNGRIDIAENTFDHDNNSISIGFNTISFDSDLSFEYSLSGLDTLRHFTNDRKVVFDRLSPGVYNFSIRAVNKSGDVTPFTEYSFEINKPYWRELWFIISIILLGFVLMLGIFYLYLKRVNKKSALSQKYAELELNALQSQMNPHFVFNAMNSIQNLINTDRVDDADRYLSKFARLMRQFLEVSRLKFIPLYEEIDIVDKYLQLEILRFGKKLSYTINNTLSDSQMEIKIPATLIQPFVENAVIHGLFHKKDKGHIEITLSRDNKTTSIRIEDDGIGRNASSIINKKRSIGHVSRGKELIDEKMKVLNQMKMYNIRYTVEDVYDNGVGIGTVVMINIKDINND